MPDMRSKIFTKFKCYNAHAHAFWRETLPVGVFIFTNSKFLPATQLYTFRIIKYIVSTDAEHAKKLSPTAQRSQSISEFTAAKSHISANCACSGEFHYNRSMKWNSILTFCRFSQSGNLNRHMRVHGTNAMIT